MLGCSLRKADDTDPEGQLLEARVRSTSQAARFELGELSGDAKNAQLLDERTRRGPEGPGRADGAHRRRQRERLYKDFARAPQRSGQQARSCPKNHLNWSQLEPTCPEVLVSY